jgi:hypothetical protein
MIRTSSVQGRLRNLMSAFHPFLPFPDNLIESLGREG